MKKFSLLNYLKPDYFLLDGLIVITVWLFINTIPYYLNSRFFIPIEETEAKLINAHSGHYDVKNRLVTSELWFESHRVLDYFFVPKNSTAELVPLLLLGFALVQLFRIHLNWKKNRFTDQLYRRIDSLWIIGAIMFVYSRTQAFYIEHRLKELAKISVQFNDSYMLLIASATISIFGVLLKSFAKQGSHLQKEQELTI